MFIMFNVTRHSSVKNKQGFIVSYPVLSGDDNDDDNDDNNSDSGKRTVLTV